MAPLVACMRSETAIDQEASTAKSTRLAVFLTRTLRWKSEGRMAKATFLRCSLRSCW